METQNLEMQQVMDRLERVERQNRWLVRGGLALALSCGIVLLMAQKSLARSIEAQKFVLKDTAGEMRAELHMTDTGPELAIWGNSRSVPDIRLLPDKAGPSLALGAGQDFVLLDDVVGAPELHLNTRKARAGLTLDNDVPELALYTQEARAFVSVDKDEPHLGLLRGDAAVAASVSNDGPNLGLNSTGKGIALLSLDKDQPHLRLYSPEGNKDGPGVYLAVDAGRPNFSLKDFEGFNTSIGSDALIVPKTGEKSQTSAASIHLFDKDGHLLWSAP
jgi:hypothetical protein